MRDHKYTPTKVRCTKQDVTVGFKLSSSAFRTTASGARKQDYDFDKHGLVLPYAAFLALMKSEDFTDTYMSKVRSQYIAETGDRSTIGLENVKGKKKISAAALRRQCAEAFPELSDSIEPPRKKNKKNQKTRHENDADEAANDDDDDEVIINSSSEAEEDDESSDQLDAVTPN